jgi:D-inositol-3-phosphate glycosyltransferase
VLKPQACISDLHCPCLQPVSGTPHMTVVLLSDDPHIAALADHHLAAALERRGVATTTQLCPSGDPADAAALGHDLQARWRRRSPSAVIAHGWLAGLAAQVAARGHDVPLVQRFGRLTSAKDDATRARLETALARGADVVLASSSEQAEQLGARGIPRSRVRVVPLGVDVGSFSDHGPARARNGRPRLVAFDSLRDHASTQQLLRTLAELPASELLLVVPSTADSGATGAAAIDAEAERLGVRGRLRLLDGLPEPELPAVLRSADVALAPADSDGSVAFVLRAMACGLPVVAADGGAMSDAVADGVTGTLVGQGSPARMADAVRALLRDSMARESYGLAATDRARVRFSWDMIAQSTAAAVELAAGARQQRAAS